MLPMEKLVGLGHRDKFGGGGRLQRNALSQRTLLVWGGGGQDPHPAGHGGLELQEDSGTLRR